MGDRWPLGREQVDGDPLCSSRLWLWGVFRMTLSRVLSTAELQPKEQLIHIPSDRPSLSTHSSRSPGWPVSGSALLGGSCAAAQDPAPSHGSSCSLQKYVQDVLQEQLAEPVYRALKEQGGHIYVCGDVTMAADVLKAIQRIMTQQGKLSAEDAGVFISRLRVSDRSLFQHPLPVSSCSPHRSQ